VRLRTISAALITAFGLGLGVTAEGAQLRRFALLIGNNEGGPQTQSLRYAEADATKLQSVLQELGGYHKADIVTLLGADVREVRLAMDALEGKLRRAKSPATTSLLVYYSGHAKMGDLRLGQSRWAMTEIKQRLKDSAADIKIGIIDACESGAITRTKGGRRGPSFLFDSDDRETARGLILISSSSQDEASQESDEIGGSFFTHYLTSGLRGDADDSKDRRVTLGEVYEYTYHRTVAVTASTRSGTQHPTYSYDLHGQGDIVLTDLSKGRTGLYFDAPLQGRFLVFDLGREHIAAEINKSEGHARRIALPPGQYAIKKRMQDHLRMVRFELLDQQMYAVNDNAMQRVAFEDDYAKGPSLRAEFRRAPQRWSFEAQGAFQLFLSSSARETLFPSLALFGASARVGPMLGGAHLQFDLLFGGRQGVRLDLGQLDVQQNFFESQFAMALMWRFGLGPVVLGLGPRLGALYMQRTFPGDEVLGQQTQDMLSFSPSLAFDAQTFLGASKSVTIGLSARSGVLLYNVDDNRTLAYVEAGLFVGYRP